LSNDHAAEIIVAAVVTDVVVVVSKKNIRYLNPAYEIHVCERQKF
jgi:hypothetical protein